MTDTQLACTVQSSARHDWATPQKWFDYLDLEFDFTLDACATAETAKCFEFYTPEENALMQSWAEQRVFMNPPFGREIGFFMEKAYRECRDHMALVVCLVPARVDTQWWHNWATKGEIRFPIGRLFFDDGPDAAPFPCAIVIFRPRLGGTL